MSVIANFSKNIQYNLKNYENKKFHEKFKVILKSTWKRVLKWAKLILKKNILRLCTLSIAILMITCNTNNIWHCHSDRQVDQWNRIVKKRTDPHKYGNYIWQGWCYKSLWKGSINIRCSRKHHTYDWNVH